MNKLLMFIIVLLVVGLLLEKGTISTHNYLILLFLVNLWVAFYASRMAEKEEKKD